MFKKRIWMPIFIGLCWFISIGGVVALMSFIEVKKSEVICRDVRVLIPGSQYFIDRQEVDNILKVKIIVFVQILTSTLTRSVGQN